MSSILRDNALSNLRRARAELVAMPKAALSFSVLNTWLDNNQYAILAAGQISGSQAEAWNGLPPLLSHAHNADPTVLDGVRDEIIASLDQTAARVEATQAVRPVLDALILKVGDAKLSTLLNEFRAHFGRFESGEFPRFFRWANLTATIRFMEHNRCRKPAR